MRAASKRCALRNSGFENFSWCAVEFTPRFGGAGESKPRLVFSVVPSLVHELEIFGHKNGSTGLGCLDRSIDTGGPHVRVKP